MNKSKGMFKLELDTEWIKKTHKACEIEVSERMKQMFEHVASGIISDAIRSAIMLEMKKPEYETQLQELVKEILLDKEAKELVKRFIARY